MVTQETRRTPETKRCPMCAETVQSQAVICRFCSYNFGTGQIQSQVADRPAVDRRQIYASAVASLVLGLVGTFWWAVAAVLFDAATGYQITMGTWTAFAIVSLAVPVLAIVFGAIGVRDVRRYPESFKGAGMAWTGVILGIVETVLILLFALVGYVGF